MSFRDDISVCIPTSVIPSHPLTHILDWCVASVRSHLFNAPIYIMADGVRPEQEDRKADYEEFKKRLVFPPWAGNTKLVEFDSFHHQAAMMRHTLQQITTPLVLFIEHDWLLLEPIPWDAMAKTILSGEADLIRLHQDSSLNPEHEYLFRESVVLNGINLRKQLVYWSQPNLGSTEWWRKQLSSRFSENCRTMIEDAIYGMSLDDKPWEDNKIFMYQPDGNMKRVSHTDGRGKDEEGRALVPKFEDKFIS